MGSNELLLQEIARLRDGLASRVSPVDATVETVNPLVLRLADGSVLHGAVAIGIRPRPTHQVTVLIGNGRALALPYVGEGDPFPGELSAEDAGALAQLQVKVDQIESAELTNENALAGLQRTPEKVEGLLVTTEPYTDAEGITQGRIKYTWIPVNTAVDDGSEISLKGYEIAARRSEVDAPWAVVRSTDSASAEYSPVAPGTEIVSRVRAVSAAGAPGEWSDEVVVVSAGDTEPPPVPSDPILSQKLAVVSAKWDGLSSTGATGVTDDFSHVEVAAGKTTTPVDIVARIAAPGDIASISGLDYAQYWFRYRSVDRSGNASAWSGTKTLTVQSLVDADLISTTIQDQFDARDAAIAQAQADAAAAEAAAATAESTAASAQTAAGAAQAAAEAAEQDAAAAVQVASDAAADLLTLSGRTGRVIRSGTAPTAAEDRSANNLWLNTDNGQLHQWNPTTSRWEVITDSRLDDAVQAATAATNAANTAQAQVDNAVSLAEAAQDQADAANSAAAAAQATATAAQSTADSAASAASAAQGAAQAAQGDADAAAQAAAGAAGIGQAAQDAADAAQSAADAAAADAIAKAAAAEQAAKDHADAQAAAAEAAAIAAASGDASDNAAAAQAAAEVAAAADAQAKADAALAAAQADATTKADAAAAIANSKADVLIQSSTPPASMQKSTTLWIDTTSGLNTPKRWNGSKWAVVTDKAATDAAAAAAAAQSTANQAAQDAATAKSDADAAAAAALAAQATADAADAKATTADGRITTSFAVPKLADGSGKPDGALWYTRSGTGYASIWEWNGSKWEQTTIGTGGISTGAITEAKIATGAISDGKLAQAVKDSISGAASAAALAQQTAESAQGAASAAATAAAAAQGDADAAQAAADDAAADLLALAGRTGRVIRATSAPTATADKNSNNLWLNTSTGQLHEWNGSKWAVITDSRLTAATATADQAANLANAAQQQADTATNLANAAKTQADTATSAASAAQAAATAAQSTASSAQSAASAAAADAAAAQGDADTAARAAADAAGIGRAAQESIDNLQIGGRNLLVRSGELTDHWLPAAAPYLPVICGAMYVNAVMANYIPVTEGETLMLTKGLSASSDGGFWRYTWHDDTEAVLSRGAGGAAELKVTVPAGATLLRVSYPRDASPKVERGNKATDWTPAPEDIDAATAAAQSAADAAAADAIAKAAAAEQAAKAHADAVAEAERLAAIAAASDDATAKANAAKAAAEATAAADAASKADAALAAAKLDATAKANAATAVANSKADVLIQSSAPAAAMRKSTTLWIDTTGGKNTPKRWTSGTTWVEVTDKAAKDAAAAAVAAQGTANQAVADAALAKSTADQAVASALAAQNAADVADGKATTATGKITIATANPTTSDASGKPIGAVWEVRSGSTVLRRYVLTGATTWTQVKIGKDFIGTDAIGQAQISDLAVGTAEIADAAITNAKIGKLAVGEANIDSAAVTNAKIKDLAVTTAKIANLAVETAKIKDGAIVTAKIGDAQITTAKIANLAVDDAKIANLAVTEGKIANLAVGTAKIADGAITNVKIGNATIEAAKIKSVDADKITTGTLDADRIGANTISAEKLLISGGNLFPDPLMLNTNAWPSSGNVYLANHSGHPLGRGLRINSIPQQIGAYYGNSSNYVIPVEPGAKYRVRATVYINRTVSGATQNLRVYFRGVTATGTIVTTYETLVPATGVAYGAAAEFETEIAAPSTSHGLVAMGFHTQTPYSEGVYFVVNNVSMMRMSGSTLIENGAVTSDKVTADAGWFTKLSALSAEFNTAFANKLTADTIGSGTLEGVTIYSPNSTSLPRVKIANSLIEVIRDDGDGGALTTIALGGTSADKLVMRDGSGLTKMQFDAAAGSGAVAGRMSVGSLTVGGASLDEIIDPRPLGMVAHWMRGSSNTASAGSADLGLCQLQYTAVAGRRYRLQLTGLGNGTAGDVLRIYTHWASGHVNATVAGTSYIDLADFPIVNGGFTHVNYSTVLPRGWNGPRTILIVFKNQTANRAIQFYTRWTVPVQAAIYDEGAYPELMEGKETRGGATPFTTVTPEPPAKQTYTKTYNATSYRVWRSGTLTATDTLEQGYYSPHHRSSNIGFANTGLITDLSGATIKKAEVYLRNEHWWGGSGGTVRVGSTRYATTYIANITTVDTPMARYEDKWVPVANFTTTTEGIVLTGNGSTSTTHYGKFAKNVQLRVTYEK